MKRLHTLLLTLLAAAAALAQERTITGTVSDGDLKGEPLVGATIAEGDTRTGTVSRGTVADLNGHYSLNVGPHVRKLTVSFMGYEPHVITLKPGQNKYDVTLYPSARGLGEVIVTGYQQIDRRKLTAAVAEVKISEETVGAIKNIDQALAGQVAGLSTVAATGAPGAPVKIRIRGTSSINGVQEPLWVLDGIPMEGNEIPAIDELNDIDDIYQTSIAGLNPSDIENITVLKDAAATAIYGARAANGVIVITTKKGKAGRPAVSFSTRFTYTPRADIGRLNLLGSSEKVDLELSLLRSPYQYRQHKGGVAEILDQAGEFDTYQQDGWQALSPETQQRISQLRAQSTDWNRILFRPAWGQEYNASLSGGSDKAHYYASAGYYKEQGTVRGVENDRMNVTMKTDFRLNRVLSIGLSLFANQRRQKSYMTDSYGWTNPVFYSRLANSYFDPWAADGSYNYDRNVQGRENESTGFNIFEERANTSKKRTDRSIMAIADATLKLLPGLRLTTQFGLQHDNYTLKRYAGQNSYAMRKEKEMAVYQGEKFLPDGGKKRQSEGHTDQWTWKAMLEWDKTFGQAHDLELMGGTEIRHVESELSTTTAYGFDDRTLTVQPVVFPTENLARQYPLYAESHTENAYVSWFATGAYTYRHRYTLGASVRFDGSDVFGVAKKYRYLPLYSFSGLWRAKEEKFMQKARWAEELNLRLSYGLQGNIDKNTSPYLIGTFRKTSVLPGHTETVIAAETAPNPNLKWEKTRNVNVGIDLSLLHGRIRLTADYYYRRSTDLISSRQLPLETGFAMTTINWASMENRGWEFSLNTRNIATRDFTWTTSLNLGLNKNKILNESVAENSTLPARQGRPVGAIFAYQTAGIDQDGFPLFRAKDGTVQSVEEFFRLSGTGASSLTAEEQRGLYTYMGADEPKVAGGLINTFEYRDWQLTLNFMFNLGMKVRTQPSYSATYFDRGQNTNHDILSRWTPENTTATLPGLLVSTPERAKAYTYLTDIAPGTLGMLDTWVKKRNYCRLQSVRLGYRLPKRWLQPIGIASASVSLEGRNLLVFGSSYRNYLDPETMGNPYAQPIPKSWIFGLSVNF